MSSIIAIVTTISLIATAASVGNGFVCYAILRNSKLHTSTFVLIVDQCISDIKYAVSIELLILVCSEWFLQRVIFGNTVCSIFSTLIVSSYIISALTMTIIAVERFVLVFYPLKPKLSYQQAWYVITGIYIICFMLTCVGYFISRDLVSDIKNDY